MWYTGQQPILLDVEMTGPEVKIFAQGVLVLFFTESSLVTFVSRPQLF
jgi:hypothetical protein